MTEDVKQLVKYRLTQAQEALDEARALLAGNHLRGAINRGYYAMFYAALGLLASRQLGTSKHRGVLSLLGQHFVKTGKFPSGKATYLARAFELRLRSDYREFAEVKEDEAEELLAHAEEFIQAVRDCLAHELTDSNSE